MLVPTSPTDSTPARAARRETGVDGGSGHTLPQPRRFGAVASPPQAPIFLPHLTSSTCPADVHGQEDGRALSTATFLPSSSADASASPYGLVAAARIVSERYGVAEARPEHTAAWAEGDWAGAYAHAQMADDRQAERMEELAAELLERWAGAATVIQRVARYGAPRLEARTSEELVAEEDAAVAAAAEHEAAVAAADA